MYEFHYLCHNVIFNLYNLSSCPHGHVKKELKVQYEILVNTFNGFFGLLHSSVLNVRMQLKPISVFTSLNLHHYTFLKKWHYITNIFSIPSKKVICVFKRNSEAPVQFLPLPVH